MKMFFGAILLVCLSVVAAQYNEGAGPPRISIPGAIPIPLRQNQYRNERVVPGPNVVRIRRPGPFPRPQQLNAIPIPQPQRPIPQEEAKPVTEEAEEDAPEFVPSLLSSQAPVQAQTASAVYSTEPNNYAQERHEEPQIPRFSPQDRPAPQPRQQERFVPESGGQRFAIQDRPVQQFKQAVRRPVYRESRPQAAQFTQEEPQQVRQVANRVIEQRPRPTHSNQDSREKKPVAQILRKYRDENEDGSITWGFENDDGSYKEEIIGKDCVTRGRYGYIDPDGLKREYNYETGILCDPNRPDLEQDEEKAGYVDYQENKAVLPNGLKIDLSNMGKNKSKRPQIAQNFYRN